MFVLLSLFYLFIESETGTTHVLREVVGTFREYRRGNQNGQSREFFFGIIYFFMSKLYDLQCNFIVKIFYKQTLLKLTLCHAKYLLFFKLFSLHFFYFLFCGVCITL